MRCRNPMYVAILTVYVTAILFMSFSLFIFTSTFYLDRGLDCALSFGFPGSVASLRQQFGRAGRNGRLGISFYVTRRNMRTCEANKQCAW